MSADEIKVAQKSLDDARASAAPPSEREAATNEFDAWWDGVYGYMSAWVNSKEIAKAGWEARAAVPQAGAERDALLKLCNEVSGILGLERYRIRELIGNTNFSVLQLRLDEAKLALDAGAAAVPAPKREKLAKSLEYAAHCFYAEQYGDEPLDMERILFAAKFAACQLTGYKTEEEELAGATAPPKEG